MATPGSEFRLWAGGRIMGCTVIGTRAPLRLVAIGGAAVYVLVLLVLPLLEPRLDVRIAHPEDYAAGGYGILVNLSYGALSLALFAIALALWPGRSWRAVGPLLLVPPAILCAALAVAPIAVARSGTVVFVCILGLAAGPLVNSIALPDRLNRMRRLLIGLGAAVLVAFIGLVVAPESISGVVNRGFDVLAGLWVATAGYVHAGGGTRVDDGRLTMACPRSKPSGAGRDAALLTLDCERVKAAATACR